MDAHYFSAMTTPTATPPQPVQLSSGTFNGQLNDLILNTFWIGALIPVSIALVLTSAHLWKRPVFILNACALACGIAFGAVNLVNIV